MGKIFRTEPLPAPDAGACGKDQKAGRMCSGPEPGREGGGTHHARQIGGPGGGEGSTGAAPPVRGARPVPGVLGPSGGPAGPDRPASVGWGGRGGRTSGPPRPGGEAA